MRTGAKEFASHNRLSYQLDCQDCGVALHGVTDPADDALTISECRSPADNP
jgi:hypothetical protein